MVFTFQKWFSHLKKWFSHLKSGSPISKNKKKRNRHTDRQLPLYINHHHYDCHLYHRHPCHHCPPLVASSPSHGAFNRQLYSHPVVLPSMQPSSPPSHSPSPPSPSPYYQLLERGSARLGCVKKQTQELKPT